ncbi:MAG: tetratricopeptide repeat protein [Candidatus Lokiarchaeota archaeon]|nr:tetratricopeptide repeat protein [Candidatus Lokiarchaeota archaeon]
MVIIGYLLNNSRSNDSKMFDSNADIRFKEKFNKLIESLHEKEGKLFILSIKARDFIESKQLDLALGTLDKALDIADKKSDQRMKCMILDLYAEVYIQKGFDDALEKLDEAREISANINYQAMIIQILMKKAKLFYNLKRYNEAIELYKEAFDLAIDQKAYNEAMYISFFLGIIFVVVKNREESLKYNFEALKYSRQLNNKTNEAKVLQSIAYDYNYQKNYNEAEKYFNQALEIERELGDIDQQANLCFTLGNLYRNEGKYVKSNEFYQLFLKLAENNDNIRRKTFADANMYIGSNFKELREYEKAKKYYIKSSKIFGELGNAMMENFTLESVVYCIGYLSDDLIEEGKFDSAIKLLENTLIFYEEKDLSGETGLRIYLKLLTIGKKIENFRIPSKYLQHAIDYTRKLLEGNPYNDTFKEYLSLFLMELIVFINSKNDFQEPDTFYKLVNEVIELNKEQTNLIPLWNAHFHGIFYSYDTKNLKNLQFYVDNAIPILISLNKNREIVRITDLCARTAKELGEKEIASKYYQLALEYSSKTRNTGMAYLYLLPTLQEEDPRVKAHKILERLDIMLEQKNYKDALNSLFEGLRYLEPYEDCRDKGLICNQIGYIYWTLKNFDKSEKYWKKAYKILFDSKNFDAALNINSNLIQLYRTKGDLENTLKQYKKRLIIIGDDSSMLKEKAYTFGFIGKLYHKLNQIELGNEFYERAAVVFEEFNDTEMALKARNTKK